ncbi:DEAD/DEAH box helicase family protein [Chitinophaga sp. HK235]|uniref:DEAD/DEAH box helicase family protein n=1 Tax=Chitinophaga sp. HK235 TaxID=2952571 RepID=UPI001BA49A51|nr:DEAD/DEAH box helicase family protein [Chitinophaga sp. HK235]
MSNFTFLNPQWPDIHETAQEAEAQVRHFPRSSALMCRTVLEQMVKWMYDNDGDLQPPDVPTLDSMINSPDFRAIVHIQSLITEITYVRKLGNLVAHKEKRVSATDALANLKYLYRFVSWFARYYGQGHVEIPPFEETRIPSLPVADKAKEDLQLIVKDLQQKDKPLLRFIDESLLSTEQQNVIKERLAATKATKDSRTEGISSPPLISEKETRLRFIDLLLEEAGWDVNAVNVREYSLKGMPGGAGRADYVLWGDDGLPLAVVEAKRTMESPKVGQHQAKLYADCLEQVTGQRPIIFYTNGFEVWLWDDKLYPPRLVSGFYTKDELQLNVSRRNSRKVLLLQPINKSIVDRYYQEEAIKRVTDRLEEKKYRGALLVMATGTGKTRVAAALVDLLTKANWVKRVLFLADRNALVTQAKRNFNNYLPNLTAIDLTKEEDDGTARIVFSTYPTIMNRIDNMWYGDKRYYGCGHFDLIIVDEAHRSVYNKYKSIFQYFDALRIGLTATPKIAGIDINTYELFDHEDHLPAFNYDLDKAVGDKYLVPPKAMSVPLRFPREGVKYDDLSPEEKVDYEERFGDPTFGVPDEIANDALNNWLFNTDTIDRVLQHLMENGLKVEGGDKLGKTIIFARNNRHAEFIEERFNKLYPFLRGEFLRVVTYKVQQVDDLIDKFKGVTPMPQIAVSVDMLDTGIDIPEVVNLVFFKPVYSSSKYWQMIGRGTRLCKDIFGPGLEKQFFYIFDYCENFEFFQLNVDGIEPILNQPLSQRIYERQLDIALLLESLQNDELRKHRHELVNDLHNKINSLDGDGFQIRLHRKQYEEYRNRDKWDPLTKDKVGEVKEHLSALVLDITGEEKAKRFDLLMYNIQLNKLQNAKRLQFYIDKAVAIAESLYRKDAIDMVREKLPVIKPAMKYEFWDTADIVTVEKIRKELRDLVFCLDKEQQQVFYTSYQDTMTGEMEEVDIMNTSSAQMDGYKRRVERFIRENESHIAIHKLKNNFPITNDDIAALERIMFEGGNLGTKAEFEKEYNHQPLGVFIRSIVGLDREAVNKVFNSFIQSVNLNANQIRFIDNIIDYLSENGRIEPEKLVEPPFTEINDMGVFGIFDKVRVNELIQIINELNEGAEDRLN